MNTGENNLQALIRNMTPELHEGDYVYCTMENMDAINKEDIIAFFREKEACTVIIEKTKADTLKLSYSYVAAWITLTIHSSLEATGFTAAFSKALADNEIGCNVIAAYYHDHIFVGKDDAAKAIAVLKELSKTI